MNELTTLTYADGIELRAVEQNGEIIVCLADLAKGLGIKQASALLRRLPDGVIRNHPISDRFGRIQNATFVTESGMNLVIWRSDKPEAIAYARWCADRIVELRTHGLTATPQTVEAMLANPDAMIKALEALKTERARRAELEAQAEADRPKVLFADSVSTSHSTVLVGEVAKILKGNGVNIGGTRLFEVLRRRGLLISREGSDRNMPTQKAMDLGLFRIKETSVVHSDGHTTVNKTPKVTGKGQQYIVQRVLSGAWDSTIAEVNANEEVA